MAFQKQPDRRRDVFAGRREEDELAAKIQRAVFIALDGSSNSQRMSQSVWRLVKRYRPVAKGSGARIALKNAAERRRVLERLERRALNLARDIDRVERDGQLSHAFERLFDLSKDDGHPPGFPDNARILDEGDLDRQFWETLQLAYAARHLRESWRARRGAPAKRDRIQFLQELARAYKDIIGVDPVPRRRDPFSKIAAVALRACGLPVADVRDAIQAALSAPEISVSRIQFMWNPTLRETVLRARRSGKK